MDFATIYESVKQDIQKESSIKIRWQGTRPFHPGEDCPRCGVSFEAGDDGRCNRCGSRTVGAAGYKTSPYPDDVAGFREVNPDWRVFEEAVVAEGFGHSHGRIDRPLGSGGATKGITGTGVAKDLVIGIGMALATEVIAHEGAELVKGLLSSAAKMVRRIWPFSRPGRVYWQAYLTGNVNGTPIRQLLGGAENQKEAERYGEEVRRGMMQNAESKEMMAAVQGCRVTTSPVTIQESVTYAEAYADAALSESLSSMVDAVLSKIVNFGMTATNKIRDFLFDIDPFERELMSEFSTREGIDDKLVAELRAIRKEIFELVRAYPADVEVGDVPKAVQNRIEELIQRSKNWRRKYLRLVKKGQKEWDGDITGPTGKSYRIDQNPRIRNGVVG